MSKPIIITCQPDDQFFLWQNHLYIESCLEVGFEEEQIHILLYVPRERTPNTNWNKLKEIYPKLNIFFYQDKGVQPYLRIYIPILRPHILWQHFSMFPELETKTIIYTDCDILWMKGLDIEKFYDDDVNYMSDAGSYLNYAYFESKKAHVLPEKVLEVEKRDFLQEACSLIGLDKQVIIDNNFNTGGVQYILKNVKASFWEKVQWDTLKIRSFFMGINKEFYESENAGIQSWCADLWAVLWNLWNLNKETKVVPEMDFAWASNPKSFLDKMTILHNAGLSGDYYDNGKEKFPVFFKGKYINGSDPFIDEHLTTVANDETSKKYCTHHYTEKLLELKRKYNLIY